MRVILDKEVAVSTLPLPLKMNKSDDDVPMMDAFATSGAGSVYGRKERYEAQRKAMARRRDARSATYKIEDGEGRTFNGTAQAKSSGSRLYYLAAVPQPGKGYFAMPVDKTYVFTKERKVAQLSLDEAEEKLNMKATPLDITRFLKHIKQDEAAMPVPRSESLFVGEEGDKDEDNPLGDDGADEFELEEVKRAKAAEMAKRRGAAAKKKTVKVGFVCVCVCLCVFVCVCVCVCLFVLCVCVVCVFMFIIFWCWCVF